MRNGTGGRESASRRGAPAAASKLSRTAVAALAALLADGCSASVPGETDGGGAGTSTSTDLGLGGGSSTGGWTPPPCDGDHENVDADGDGYTGAQGDCNDCTNLMNPAARDYPGNGVDEDCNGAADDGDSSCDDDLAMDSADPMDAVRAIGLCREQLGASWGVKSAAYVASDGSPLSDPLGHGLVPSFGDAVHPQEGKRMLVLSSGAARRPSDADYKDVAGYDKGYTSAAPAGYPKEAPACPGIVSGEPHDAAGLEVVLQTPSNAKSMGFKLDFYTYEYPDYICSKYNDYFVALVSPPPPNLPDGNVSFDKQGNTISANAGFLEVCSPQQAGGKTFACAKGTSQLGGTGFEGHAATGWLKTSVAVTEPGKDVTVRFAVWDSGDGVLDSTVLVDDFQFEIADTPTVTEPVDEPK